MGSNGIPMHVGFIPDGNRRWAVQQGLMPGDGYAAGVKPGLRLAGMCAALRLREISIYGFTQDNTRRPKEQTEAFRAACTQFARGVLDLKLPLYALGDTRSPLFPKELIPFSAPPLPTGKMRVNLLVNYGWNWDLQSSSRENSIQIRTGNVVESIASAALSRIDLIVRWGGCRRLSGFLPVQSVYADFFVIDDYWPDFQPSHFEQALDWYAKQDATLGG
jgi:undecaprenyl diphosphate synthase